VNIPVAQISPKRGSFAPHGGGIEKTSFLAMRSRVIARHNASMERGEYKPEIAKHPESVKFPRESLWYLVILPGIERLLLVLGLVLLALYVSARIREIILSRVAVKQFEALKHSAPQSAPGDEKALPLTSKPDFVSWSGTRIRAYYDSLDQHLAAPVAVLRIPKIRLEVPVLEGTDDWTLNRGVGRIKGTALPGENGNIAIAGHRDGFFRGLKELRMGDRIELEGREQTETYVVDHLQVVDPKNVQVLQPGATPSLTLVTCYPFYYIGSAPKRYIVHASRTSSEPGIRLAHSGKQVVD